MAVYLTENEINDIVKRFNGAFIINSSSIYLLNNKHYNIILVRLKKQEKDKYKICMFKDVIQHWKSDNTWVTTYETSNYGKPKTKEEFYNRLDMLSKNLVKINKTIKEWSIKLKEIEIENDFN